MLNTLVAALASYAERHLACFAYLFQSWAVGEVATAAKLSQTEISIRDHEHGNAGVTGTMGAITGTTGTFTGLITANAGISIPANQNITLGGVLIMQPAASKIIPGVTSLSLRNNADALDNLLITDAGNATLRGTLTILTNQNITLGGVLIMQPAASKIIPGVTSLSLRNNADALDNLLITDAGNATLRGTLTSTGLITANAGISVPTAQNVTGAGTARIIGFDEIVSGGTTATVFNATATTVNAFGAASTALNIGHASGVTTILGASVIVGNLLTFINDTSNGNMTVGLTINQGANDNEILALKSSDVAHGITAVTETDTFATFRKQSDLNGGIQLRGFSEVTTGIELAGVHTTDDTTKSTTGVGTVKILGFLKTGTDVTVLGANANLLTVGTGAATTRFILDSDGDSHQDVGTAWTNFDGVDDVETLNALAYNVARDDDPIKLKFRELLFDKRVELARHKLVTFNEDGHHFVNMSKLAMLNTGAIRQLGESMIEQARRIELLEKKLLH